MRIFQPISAMTGVLFLLVTDAATERVGNMALRRRAEQRIAKYGLEGSTKLQRLLQDRVSNIDLDGLSCVAGTPSSIDVAFKVTTIQYYYALESSEIISNHEVEDLAISLFEMVSSRTLWCTSETSPPINVITPPVRKLAVLQQYPELAQFAENHRSLSLEEARRLAIVSITSSPLDAIVHDLNCPYEFEAKYCVVLAGKVKIIAQQSDNLALVVASILDASEFLMESNILLGDAATPDIVTNIQWLGETLEEARAFGTDADAGGGVLPGVEPAGNEEEPNSDNSSGITTIFAVSVPLIILLGFAFLMTKIRRQRAVMTPVELEKGDQGVLVGTGDPPRSFHKGFYHYTRGGSRYLSTNCSLCADTRMSGFFTDGDLPTITEGHLFGVASSEGESYDDFSLDLENPVEPGMRFISPNSKNLGGIHSGIDVHQCTSATCNICKFRGDEVVFLSSPKKEENSNPGKAWREEDDIISDSDDSLGERCVVDLHREEDDIISDNDDGLGERCVVDLHQCTGAACIYCKFRGDEVASLSSRKKEETTDVGKARREETDIISDNDDALVERIISDNDDGLGERCVVDLHQCTSATCNICKFRGDEVASLSSPKKEENSSSGEAWHEEDNIISDNDDGLGERCVVDLQHEEDGIISDHDDGLDERCVVDLHQCTSATCNICKFRGGEVASLSTPKKEEKSNPGKAWHEEDDIISDSDDALVERIISDNDDGLGERCVVDLHQCTSATCNICKFRGDEVASLSSRKKEEKSNPEKSWREEDDIISDNDDGLGELCEEDDDIISDHDDGLGGRCVADLHQCTSATCIYCKFRGDEVAFLSSRKKEEKSNPAKSWREEDDIFSDIDDGLDERREEDDMISDNDDGLGERCTVDVHQCTSATCIYCKFRGDEVASLSSPKMEESSNPV